VDTALHTSKITLLIGLAIIVTVSFFVSPCNSAERFPRPRGAVNDFAGVISARYENDMELLAKEVLQKTNTSVVVATMKSIEGREVADYANRLYEAWGIGVKGVDKGVLIFLTLEERKVWIETGYGVEGILPDGLVGEILDKYTVPYLRKGNYDRGLASALSAVSSVIARDAKVSLSGTPTMPRVKQTPPERGVSVFSLIAFFIVMSLLLGTRQGRAMLPLILLMFMMGSRGGGAHFGGFGGGFGGFGGGLSGGGGAGRGF